MARKYQNGFVSVLIPLVLMSILIFNADTIKHIGNNVYIYFHPESSSVVRYSSVYGSNSRAIPIVKKLLTKAEMTKEFSQSPKIEGTEPDMTSPVNGITYQENRVLYKVYKAAQEPDFECVIRIQKYRRPKAEEVQMDHSRWNKSECAGSPCSIETRYSLHLEDFRDSDIVILLPGPVSYYEWSRLLEARPPGQLWALYSRESPVHEPQFTPPAELFTGNPYNLSMTFRSGSDIDLSYGRFLRDSVRNKKKIGEKTPKSKQIMWMASRCEPLGWERTKLAHEIKKYLQVDIYGKCGTFECPKHDFDSCLPAMQQYKFYLALENSECAEYITEKVWLNAYGAGLVPIVYGAFKEDYVRRAPPDSFIHLDDFSTMQDFVDYINLLDRNDTLYAKYFEWKKLGRTVQGMGFRTALSSQKLCKLSKKMVEISLFPENSWRWRVSDFGKWWGPTCRHQKTLLGVEI